MAIQFARIKVVQRSKGQNACHKAAYNGRKRIEFEREGRVYDFSHKGDGIFHTILLPKGVDPKFSKTEALWNEAENSEVRTNSQVAKEMVLALPDNREITIRQKIELAKGFVQEYFVNKGLAAQIDIHQEEEEDHNWHAHVLLTTRKFASDGKSLGKKARDLDGDLRGGRPIGAKNWGELWKNYQNQYFEERDLRIRVDPTGIIPQEHLGPVRMRGLAYSLISENEKITEENETLSQKPSKILEALTKRNSIFTMKDFENFLDKHVPEDRRFEVEKAFWKQKDILSISENSEKFTSKYVREEEERIVRFVDRISQKSSFYVSPSVKHDVLSRYTMNEDQIKTFNEVVNGKRFTCVQGRAGTGKTYLLKAIQEAYEEEGFNIRGFAPTSEVAKNLKDEGIKNSENIHRFLFLLKSGKISVSQKEVWIFDEAGMIGNQSMQEIMKKAWKHQCMVVFVGDEKQLPPVDRGGLFRFFCEKHGASKLHEVMRQEEKWQKDMSEDLSSGKFRESIDELDKQNSLHWSENKTDSMINLMEKWEKDSLKYPEQSFLILEHRNAYAKILNEIAHKIRLDRGEVSSKEYGCETFLGKISISEGDRIQFRSNDRKIGVTNGLIGTVKKIDPKKLTVTLRDNLEVTFDPKEYTKFQLGYAGTFHRSQGKTVDRTYVLHSYGVNRNLFYVGLTRQKKSIEYFVSKEDAKNLEDLKNQISRKGGKETTFDHIEEQKSHSNLSKAWMTLKDYFYTNRKFYSFKKDPQDRGVTVTTLKEKEGYSSSNSLEKLIVFDSSLAAEKAKNHFPSYRCVSKKNLSELNVKGKSIIIWPNNDQRGLKEAKRTIENLRTADFRSLKMIRENMLSKFPEGWSFEKPLPSNCKIKDLETIIQLAKSVSIEKTANFSKVKENERI